MGVARGAVGAGAPPKREIKFLGFNVWGKLQVHPRGQECTASEGEKSHFYWAGEGAVFN